MEEKRLFRLLRADEIECRVQTIKESGLSLLLYKDARCDMCWADYVEQNFVKRAEDYWK